jgi:hypothetical protein
MQAVKDPVVEQNFRRIAQQFPIGAANLAGGELIEGAVSKEGVILGGSGFTVAHPETGRYKIKLPKAASAPLLPVAVLYASVATNQGIEVTEVGSQEFLVTTFTIAGGPNNNNFIFHVRTR